MATHKPKRRCLNCDPPESGETTGRLCTRCFYDLQGRFYPPARGLRPRSLGDALLDAIPSDLKLGDELARALARIGFPVAVTVHDWARDADPGGAFLIGGPAEGGGVYLRQVHAREVIDCLFAYDFRPDGSPL